MLIFYLILFVVLKIIFFLFFSKKNWYEPYSKLLQDLGIIVAVVGLIITYIQTKESLNFAKDANEQSELSSKHTDTLANKTIELLDNISKSSGGLSNNLDSISFKMKYISQNLSLLSTNLEEINKYSNEQVLNLKEINLSLKEQEESISSQDSIRRSEISRKPKFALYYICDRPSINQNETIFLKNIGNIKAHLIRWSFKCKDYKLRGVSESFDLAENSSIAFRLEQDINYEMPQIQEEFSKLIFSFKIEYSSDNIYSNYSNSYSTQKLECLYEEDAY